MNDNVWRLLDTGHRSAAENMALDQVILEARSRGLVPNTLRFLQFDPHCVLVGYHQAVSQEVRVDYCHARGIEINRRITGGGALYWGTAELGWEIFASRSDPRFARPLDELYAYICEGAVRGLAHLGIRAAFRPRNDIEINGRKISGTGGTAQGEAFLFQGTLLVDFDLPVMLRALRIPTEKLADKEIDSLRERVTCLRWEMEAVPPMPQIKAALAEGFAQVLDVTFAAGDLSAAEEEMLDEQLPYFRSEGWIYGTRRPLSERRTLRSIYRAPGGVIRTALVVNSRARRIQMAFISGDFFVYPQRAILDLEAALKNAPASEAAVGEIVQKFFADHKVHIPGVTAADLSRAVGEALARLDFHHRLGVSLEEANYLFTVVRSLDDMPRPQTLLLPYCAKAVDCDYRYREGCLVCGRCSVGDAYAIADRYGLAPITIQNYEMLEDVLRQRRAAGDDAFVGTCCQAFYAKHRADFERLALPGVLVDLDSATCYDLGEEEKAHRGQYENQTNLRLGLLERVVSYLAGNR